MNVAEYRRDVVHVRGHARPDDVHESVEHLRDDEPEDEAVRAQKHLVRFHRKERDRIENTQRDGRDQVDVA